MIHVYIAHPLNADTRAGIEQNRLNATLWVEWAARQNVAPMAMWIVLTGAGWENSPEDRELGLKIDEAQVALCDEIWLCGGRVSSGMQRELDKARAAGKRVVDLTRFGALPPPFWVVTAS
jgi:hypothetical protein